MNEQTPFLTHKERFLQTITAIGKVYNGKLDPEYAAALYLLTVDEGIWGATQSSVSRHGIDFPKI